MSTKTKTKKKTSKKVAKKSTTNPKPKTDKKNKSVSIKVVYKRGSLSQAVWELLCTKGVDNVLYQEMEDLALGIMPNSKFNKSHYSWYKNKFRKDLEAGKYPKYKF